MTDDRRHFERFPFSARLEVRLGRATASAIDRMEATATDVSVSGFGFRSSTALAVGDVIAVTLPELVVGDDGPLTAGRSLTPDEDPDLEIIAIVRHVHATDGSWAIGAECAA